MTTTALRLYGKRDLRPETFYLPEMPEDEVLATVVTASRSPLSRKSDNTSETQKK
ncbi:L-sorbose 1-phosphate dehydrogenase [Escherichia coli]|nr:L-sorbose 1-phosphate dehydrogenase [Escherichia coli]